MAQVNQQYPVTGPDLIDEFHGIACDFDEACPLRLNVQGRDGNQLRLGLDDWRHSGRHFVRLSFRSALAHEIFLHGDNHLDEAAPGGFNELSRTRHFLRARQFDGYIAAFAGRRS